MTEPEGGVHRIIVTGATSGVGGAVVLRELAAGNRVLATGRNASRLDALARKADARGQRDQLDLLAADLCSDQDLVKLVNRTENLFNSGPDGLVHTAFGHIGEDEGKTLEDLHVDEIRDFISSSVTASILLVKAFLPMLRRIRNGRMVFVVADWGFPQHNVLLSGKTEDGAVGSATFVSAKYAIHGLASSIERESGIAVSAIYPGVVASSAGEDDEGVVQFFDIDDSDDVVQSRGGYNSPIDAIPLSDLAESVHFVLNTRATAKAILLKPRDPGYIGL